MSERAGTPSGSATGERRGWIGSRLVRSMIALLAGGIVLELVEIVGIYGLMHLQMTSGISRNSSILFFYGHLAVAGALGGMVTAWIARRRPLMHAGLIGFIWWMIIVPDALRAAAMLPGWRLLGFLLIPLPGALLGGYLVSRRRKVMTIRTGAAMALIVVLPLLGAAAAADRDEEGIRAAVLDYANSAYEVKPELVERSVHPKLQKIGYTRGQDGAYREHWMNYYELKELVSGWNKEGRFDPVKARREIKVLDRLDRTAVARLDAEWGVDFFHLAKIDGRWTIMNVIWQTYPPEPAD